MIINPSQYALNPLVLKKASAARRRRICHWSICSGAKITLQNDLSMSDLTCLSRPRQIEPDLIKTKMGFAKPEGGMSVSLNDCLLVVWCAVTSGEKTVLIQEQLGPFSSSS
jgi:hypothetical protein